jgi:hypothetical protein
MGFRDKQEAQRAIGDLRIFPRLGDLEHASLDSMTDITPPSYGWRIV